MKKQISFYYLLASMLVVSSDVLAQENETANTLLGNGTLVSAEHIGFFVAPTLGITSMDGSGAGLLNLRGGITIKDRFSLGMYASTSLNEITPESETLTGVYMDYWSFGGFLEYTLLAKKVLHVTFPLYVGYGEVQMDTEIGEAGLGEANFFQIEPAALLEVNLHKNVRLNLGAGYRIVGQMNYRNFNQSDISGFTGYAGLKIGLFR